MTGPVEKEPGTAMPLGRFASLLDAYGAAPERWPEVDRAAAAALLADSEDARTLRREAAPLDDALDLVEAPAPSPELARRVEELISERPVTAGRRLVTKPSLARRLGAWRAAWRPAILAASGALGLAAGIAAAQPPQTTGTAFDTVELSALAGGLADLRVAELFEDQ
ncbi:MAG: hypothetical protein IID55_08045 [Proteobacteria bacterium]|nr:hypothetical protein [Pseudomonadota bacterium]